MGFFGYLKYGDEVQGSITLNLPQTPANEVCRLMFALAIFLSYALQMYVPVNLIWPWIHRTFELREENPRTKTYEMCFRAAMVTGTCKCHLGVARFSSNSFFLTSSYGCCRTKA